MERKGQRNGKRLEEKHGDEEEMEGYCEMIYRSWEGWKQILRKVMYTDRWVETYKKWRKERHD